MQGNIHHPASLAELVPRTYVEKYISAFQTVGDLWYETAKISQELYNLCYATY